MTFLELSIYFKKLEETASRNLMTVVLAELFQKASPDEIGEICYLLLGRVAPLYKAIEFGVADKFVIRAIAQAYFKDSKNVLAAFKKYGDLGETAQLLHTGKGKSLTVGAVFARLYEITQASGPGSQEKKITTLARLLASVNALSARYIARIPLDKLRLGFSDMTMLDGLSWMLVGDKSLREQLELAYNVRPDIGFIAQTVKTSGIEELTNVKAKVGAPILACLCQRLPSADEMIKKMGSVAVEGKYDGVRVQIHYKKVQSEECKVQSFSRNLENTTKMFPELQDIEEQLDAKEVILDSEAVGVDPKTGKLIPFQETMTRKRKHGIAEKSLSVPLKFFVFDILYKNGQDLLNVPFSDRRKELEKTIKSGDLLVISPQIITDSAVDIRKYHDEQLSKGLEGTVVKKLNSPYEPGRRGYSWVKFKEEEGKTGKLADTIDAVVMGYYRGEGKRTGFGIGAFLVGVKKGESFVTITKIGTGVSDQLWRDLNKAFSRQSSAVRPKEYLQVNKLFIPDVWVKPEIVVEITGDDLTKSPTHGAGVAVRFPRLVRIRMDKSRQQITTVAEVKKMYEQQ